MTNVKGPCFYYIMHTQFLQTQRLLLRLPQFEAHFTPCIEVGWRLASNHWGNGYAPEAAKEVLRDAFDRLNLEEIVSFTSTLNQKSIRVMEKIGMKRNPQEDFLHSLIEDSHRLKSHVLYRLSKKCWSETNT